MVTGYQLRAAVHHTAKGTIVDSDNEKDRVGENKERGGRGTIDDTVQAPCWPGCCP
jgi:hypothetical protein